MIIRVSSELMRNYSNSNAIQHEGFYIHDYILIVHSIYMFRLESKDMESNVNTKYSLCDCTPIYLLIIVHCNFLKGKNAQLNINSTFDMHLQLLFHE